MRWKGPIFGNKTAKYTNYQLCVVYSEIKPSNDPWALTTNQNVLSENYFLPLSFSFFSTRVYVLITVTSEQKNWKRRPLYQNGNYRDWVMKCSVFSLFIPASKWTEHNASKSWWSATKIHSILLCTKWEQITVVQRL